jgi:DNA replication protein DnaC
MNLVLERVASLAERLKLPALTVSASALTEEAAARDMGYAEFLEHVLTQEAEAQERRTVEMLSKVATLPFRRTLEEFDFTFQPTVKERQLRELASCAFIERKENVIFLGPPGVGKSHLAVALSLEALRRCYKVKFTTAASLTASLAEGEKVGTLARRLALFTGPALLVIDEIGFLPLDAHQANLFFQVVSRRYEHGSIILTSNKSYGEWAEVFTGDVVIAAAILDRLLHHSTTIAIRGESYRLKDKKRAGLVAGQEQQQTT